MDWLRELEEKVAKVRQALEEARRENRTLRSKLRRLEQKKGGGAATAPEDSWSEDRQEVRRRVQGLVDKLESLLKQ